VTYRRPKSRIKLDVLHARIERRGFGHVDLEHIIMSIRCRQLLKLSNPEYDHPLRGLILEEGIRFQLAVKLKPFADEVANIAHETLKTRLLKIIEGADTESMGTNQRLLEAVRVIPIISMCKPAKINGSAFTELVH